jgi:two-component system, chemotaxis family, sensor kinase CheA
MTDPNDPIIRVFLQEGSEQIETLNALLLRLESSPDDADLLGQMMRTTHNLKGASGTAGLAAISEAAHKIEEVVQRLRAGTLTQSASLCDVLFKAFDALEASLEEIDKGNEEPEALGRVLGEIDRLLSTRAAPPSGGTPEHQHAAGFVLGEYDHVRIKVLKQRGNRLVRANLTIPASEPDAPQFARRVIRILRKSCEVVATTPREADLGPVQPGSSLAALCGTTLSNQKLLELLAEQAPAGCEVHDVDGAVAPAAHPEHAHAKARGSVKVDLARVDRHVDVIGELVIVQSMLANAPELSELSSLGLHNYLGQLARITRELQDSGLRLRMVPVRGVFQAMARTSRDLARKHDKAVTFVTSGEDVEMDRSVVEKLSDPLGHLVRNAIDHGVEPSAERERTGKPKTATVTLSAYHQGGSIVVEIRDDGRGIDRERVLERARAMGVVRDGTTPSESEILGFIFESGFSTAAEVTDTSGRGVGLDIVRRNVEAMRGRVSVLSEPGRGTTLRMVLPLTLAIIDGMLIACGTERYIIPTIAIVESIRPEPGAVVSVSGRWQMLNVRGAMLPLVPLGNVLGSEAACADASKGLVVVVEGSGRKVGLVVDSVISRQQVVIKTLGGGLGTAKHLSGAAILPDGAVGLILNIDEISAAGTHVPFRDAAAWSDDAASEVMNEQP